MRIVIALLLCFPGQAVTLLRVSCGSTGGTDSAGNPWTADAGFAGGYSWTSANQPALGTQDIPYRAMRASSGAPFSYTLTPASPYNSITLKFIEPNKTATAERIFSITINGSVVNPSVDLFAATGLLKPFTLTFSIVGSGPLVITLTPVTGNAVLSGIQVDGPAPPLPVLYQSGTEAAKPPACPTAPTLYRGSDSHLLYWCAPGEAGWKRILDSASFLPGPGIQIVNPPPGGGPSIISVDSAFIPTYGLGPIAQRPAACSAGQIWLATDTPPFVTFCQQPGTPGIWSGGTPAANVLQCQGNGTDPITGNSWNCAGMFQVAVLGSDGSLHQIVGAAWQMTPAPPFTWVPVVW